MSDKNEEADREFDEMVENADKAGLVDLVNSPNTNRDMVEAMEEMLHELSPEVRAYVDKNLPVIRAIYNCTAAGAIEEDTFRNCILGLMVQSAQAAVATRSMH